MHPSAPIDDETARRIEFDRFLDGVPDYAIYLLDPDGRVMTWNRGAKRLQGYDADEIMGKPHSLLFPEDTRERNVPEQNLRTAAETGRSEYEDWLVREDGSRFWAHVVTTPIRGDDTLLGFAQVTRDRTAQRERKRALQEEEAFTESVFDAQPDIIYTFDRNGNLLQWNDRVNEITGYSDEELDEMDLLDFIPEDDREQVAKDVRRIVEDGITNVRESALVTKDGDHVPYEFTGAPITREGEVVGVTGIGRDISERKARERELRRQHTELQRLNRVHAAIRGIEQVLVDAETCDEIRSTVVDQFAAAEPYAFALLGEVDPALERITPRVWAGVDEDHVPSEGILPPIEGGSFADRPEAVALDARSVQVLQDVPEETEHDRWRADARERGYHSVAVVPIVAADRQYGILGIYSHQRITERERRVLEEFGRTVGHAMDSLEVRQLLYADTVLELEFRSSDPEVLLVDLSRRATCRISLERIVSMRGTVRLYYVTVRGASAEEISACAVDDPIVSEARLISDRDDESVWEFEVHDATLRVLLADYGARIKSAVADHGEARIVAEVGKDADVRSVVEAFKATYPGSEFVAKREVERSSETHGGFQRRVLDDLTDKQRTALEAAHYAGYFDYPSRGRTAEELADTLGISRSTLQQHLRVAQQKLLTAFFDRSPR